MPGTDGRGDQSSRRTLGVLGTLVWDRIIDRDARIGPVEEWGGLGYALAALSTALGENWRILPIVKVGRDRSEDAFRFLSEIERVDDSAVVVVPEPTDRVELRYSDSVRRTERVEGGVPRWEWPELAPFTEICDALYVNFITGREIDLATARALRIAFRGPTYADLHSLFTHVGSGGYRGPRELHDWRAWISSFDAVQMNEDEFEMLGAGDDPWEIMAHALVTDPRLVTVTLGERGAAYLCGGDFPPSCGRGDRRGGVHPPPGVRSGRVALDAPPVDGDPTGCGDVWGATAFARLLAGEELTEALGLANVLASRNVAHRGARGLDRHLKGRIARIPA